MKNIHKYLLLIFVISITSCINNEEDSSGSLTIFDLLAGDWKFDENYIENGNPKKLNSFDTLLYITFSDVKPRLDLYSSKISWSAGYEDNIFEISSTSSPIMEQKSLGYDRRIYSDIVKYFFSSYTKLVGEEKSTAGNGNLSYYQGIAIDDLVVRPKVLCNDITFTDFVEGCTEHLTYLKYQEIDKIEFKHGHFVIESMSANKMRLKYYTNYYGRTVNGQSVEDEFIFDLYKSNKPKSFTIPPINLDYFKNDILFRYKFDNSNETNLEYSENNMILGDGVLSNSANLNGKNHIFIEKDIKLLSDTNKTYSIWFKPSTNGRNMILWSKYSNLFGPYFIRLNGSDLSLSLVHNDGDGNLWTFKPEMKVSVNEWNNLVLINRYNIFIDIYINGIFQGRGELVRSGYDASGSVIIGNHGLNITNSNFNDAFRGQVDEFVGFKRPLNDAEIFHLYKWYKEQ